MKQILEENKQKIKEENGAISTLVLFTVLVFVAILGGSYFAVTSLQKSQLKSDLRIQEIYGKDVDNVDEIYKSLLDYAKYDEPYIPEGFTHIGTEDWNSGYRISDTGDETGNIFVWVPCVTDQAKVKEGDTVVTFRKIFPTTTETTDPYYRYNKNNYTIIGDESPASDVKTSVEQYGGFYIAAYEAGIEGTEENYSLETRTITDGSIKPLSKAGKGLWNSITRTDALIVASSMVNTSDGVKSGLISGECWDTTLQWMVNSSTNKDNEPNLGYDIDSTENGWYNNVANNTRSTTGYKGINNIYDMAGNVWEWTTENCTYNGNSCWVDRGGNYSDSGSEYPAAYRAYNDNAYGGIGFRVVLYKAAPSYDNPYIPTGFTHTAGTWNSGYTIKETSTGNEFVWVPCVLDQSKVKEGDKVVTFRKITEGKYSNSLILSTTDKSIIDSEPTEAIRTSVGKYRGFYIAKYEAGVPLDENGNEIAAISATASQKARSASGATTWTNITRTNAITAASNMVNTSDGVKSGLISGECWDTTLQWMVKTSDNAANEPNSGYDIDSTGKGYYGQSSKTITGQYPINSIYDMAGNVYEWTTENCIYNGYRSLVFRGGAYGGYGSTIPAAIRGNYDDNAFDYISFRIVLYK